MYIFLKIRYSLYIYIHGSITAYSPRTIQFSKMIIKIHFFLVLKGNHIEVLVFRNIHISLKDFRLLFGAIKYSFVYWARNSPVKISLKLYLLYKTPPHPVFLKASHIAASLLWKRTKSWTTSIHLGKKNRKFCNANSNESFSAFVWVSY